MREREDNESTGEITQTWKKLENNAKTVGFREGVEAGKEKLLQEYFDEGYRQGFKTGFEIGKYKAALSSLNKDSTLEQLVDNPSGGYCIICKNDEHLKEPVLEIINKQLEISNSHFNELYAKHGSIVLENKITVINQLP